MDRITNVTAVTEVQAGRGPARDTVLLGKYRVESTLGFGGMGLVIKAHNIDLDQHVAIKLLREDVQVDGDNIQRFVREAKNAVRLKSEHVARILDVGTFSDGRPFMVMELLEGLDLGKMLLDHGRLDRARAVDLVLQACDAIAEAHSLGIVHRDLKPTNLFVARRRDGSELLKVLDFGISKAQMGPDMSLTQTQSMLGTPAYMSPEQMRSARTVDRRSDIWSLGCVLYELVEGRPPFDAENFAELCVMVSVEPFSPLVAAPELVGIIDRALAKTVEQRYQDVADFAWALEPYASEPERAHRQVARIFRMVGRVHPEGRDSTPMPLPPRGNHSQITRPASAFAPVPTVLVQKSGLWKTLVILGILFGVGIAAGVLVMGSEEEIAPIEHQSTTADDVTDEVAGSAAGSASELTIARDDAGIEAAAPDASIEPIAPVGVGSAKPTATKPKPKRPPKRPVKPPPKPIPSAGSATKPPPPPPPKPKCDPFANPKGCN